MAALPPHSRPEIMIVAGEASGDMHGAALVTELKALRPELRFCGMGGREMASAGVELLADAARLAVVGLVEVLSRLPDILRAGRALTARMRARQPELLILIDYPDFNLLLARFAKKLGIPVLYYISPQIWAWRKQRVHSIGRLTDCVAVILPFEAELYTRHGYQARFVGHPLLDRVHPEVPRAQFLANLHLAAERPVVGIMPGSRRREIQSLLPAFLATAARLDAEAPEAKRPVFLLPQASTVKRSLLDECGLLQYQSRLDIRVLTEQRYSLMAACDAALAASGTVTLELALLRVPTVAAYRVAFHSYWLGKLIIRVLPFFSLPNLIAGRQIIPELLQDAVTPKRLLASIRPLLGAGKARSEMLAGFDEIKKQLGSAGAARRTARLALQLMGDGGLCRDEADL